MHIHMQDLIPLQLRFVRCRRKMYLL